MKFIIILIFSNIAFVNDYDLQSIYDADPSSYFGNLCVIFDSTIVKKLSECPDSNLNIELYNQLKKDEDLYFQLFNTTYLTVSELNKLVLQRKYLNNNKTFIEGARADFFEIFIDDSKLNVLKSLRITTVFEFYHYNRGQQGIEFSNPSLEEFLWLEKYALSEIKEIIDIDCDYYTDANSYSVTQRKRFIKYQTKIIFYFNSLKQILEYYVDSWFKLSKLLIKYYRIKNVSQERIVNIMANILETRYCELHGIMLSLENI